MGREGVSEMVERVARAICREMCDGDVVHICDRENGGPCKPHACRFWLNQSEAAKAAIMAMRDPSKEMVEASLPEAWIGHPEASDATIERYWAGHRRAGEKKWRAMIDASLAPSPIPEP